MTSENGFALNLKLQEYLKVNVHHISCMHEKTGQLSSLSGKMFLRNDSNFDQIGKSLFIPQKCIMLTKDNNQECSKFFENAPEFILQCRNNEVYATGNISYFTPELEENKLSYVPIKIFNTLSHFYQIQ